MSVQSIMDDAQAFALQISEACELAQQNMTGQLIQYGAAAQSQIDDAGATPPLTTGDAPEFVQTSAPPLPQHIDLALPDPPEAPPEYQDISNWTPGDAPTFTVKPPGIVIPTKPSSAGEFAESLPSFSVPDFPEAPASLTEITFLPPDIFPRAPLIAPQLLAPQPVTKPTGVAPIAPVGLDAKYTAAYSGQRSSVVNEINGYVDAELIKLNPQYHTQMTAIESQLTKYLAGGTGMKPEVEDAIYARAQAKNDVEAKKVQDAAFSDIAARGFTMPTGVLTAALNRARQDAANNNVKQATDLAVMQMEMEQKNLQFAVTTSTNLRVALVNSMLSYMQSLGTLNGQALEFAKGQLTASIETYNLAVKSYEVGIEAFKVEVLYFESQLKQVLANVEIFQAEIKNEESLINADRAKVDLYRAQLEGLNTLANVYKSQVDAAIGQASLEKLKLEAFQAKVQAFGAKVQAKDAEWRGFTALLSGEEAKANIYGKQVDAFNAEMKGYAAKLEGQTSTVQSQSMTNKARADQYSGTVQSFVAQVQAEADRARTELQNQQQYWSAYNAKNQNEESVNRINLENYRQTSAVALQNYTQSFEYKLKSAGLSLQQMGVYGSSVGEVIKAQAQIGQAALAGINTLASEQKNE